MHFLHPWHMQLLTYVEMRNIIRLPLLVQWRPGLVQLATYPAHSQVSGFQNLEWALTVFSPTYEQKSNKFHIHEKFNIVSVDKLNSNFGSKNNYPSQNYWWLTHSFHESRPWKLCKTIIQHLETRAAALLCTKESANSKWLNVFKNCTWYRKHSDRIHISGYKQQLAV